MKFSQWKLLWCISKLHCFFWKNYHYGQLGNFRPKKGMTSYMACSSCHGEGDGVNNFIKNSVGEGWKILEGGFCYEGVNFSRVWSKSFFWKNGNMCNHRIKHNHWYALKRSVCTKEIIRCIRITHWYVSRK